MKLVRFLAVPLLGAGLLAASASGQVTHEQTPPQPEPPTAPASPADPARQQMEAEVARLRAQAEAMQQRAEALRAQVEREATGDRRPGMGRPAPGGMAGMGMGSAPGMGMGRATMMMGDRPFQEQIERMRSWLDTVERYTKLARDPSDTAVAAVITANDLLRSRGPQKAIEFFEKVLPQVKNDAVRRAIQLQLTELYKAAGQQEKALEQLQSLIMSAPAMPTMPGMPGMPSMMPMHEMMRGMMTPHAPSAPQAPVPHQPSETPTPTPMPHQQQ